MMNKKEESLTYYKASTPYGSISEIILPDSSKVWLDAGSTLEYPSQFINNTRRVCMSGEAYFEVHADKITLSSFKLMNWKLQPLVRPLTLLVLHIAWSKKSH